MKKVIAALLSLLLLAGCGERGEAEAAPAETDLSTPAPVAELTTPFPEPTPDPAEDPGGYLLQALGGCLDEGDVWTFRFWIFPGSGPVPVRMPESEFGPALRELFGGLDWEMTDWEYSDSREEKPATLPGAYGIQFVLKDGAIHLHSNDDVVWVDGAEGRLYFRAEGAEALCDQIADLWPGPEGDMGRVRVLPGETGEATAQAYLDGVFAKLKADGHITGHEVRSLELERPAPPEGEEYEGPETLLFQTVFALQPADPARSCWQDGKEEETGWVECGKLRVSLILDSGDGNYELYYYDWIG